ncbi:MAG: HEAT repeat domain-containing protein [Chloroflexaceae bacterium]|nr:HEAT repeat domain-containing protein [Chloroflexaceae bacterium]
MSPTPQAVQQLLQSEDYGDRIRGLNQLRQLDPTAAFTLIQPLITDSNSRVRYAAVSQLDSLGHQDPQAALTILRDRLNQDSEIDVRAAAADALGGLKLTEAFSDLEYLYHHSNDWLLQMSIVAALGEMGDRRALALLLEALNSEISLVKTAAISALGELGDSRALEPLLPFASDSDWQIRYRLAQALGHLGGERAIAVLQTLAEDSVDPVAQEAQRHLSPNPLES